jgi:hypothetical protein
VGTSATIKSISDDAELSREEALRLRDEAVQDFFAKLTGVETGSIRVFGEEIEDIEIPPEAAYPATPVDPGPVDIGDIESVRSALCALAAVPTDTPLPEAAKRCRLLWDLNRWLTGAPMSISRIVSRLRQEVVARQDASDADLWHEVEAALLVGAALPDGIQGVLRLRAHRFIRGGWRFHRCVQPGCGRLYPMGEERCGCGFATAPLYLCRNCGADYLRFVGDPDKGPLHPSAVASEGPERMLYEPSRFETTEADEEFEEEEDTEPEPGPRATRRRGGRQAPQQIKRLPVLHGSFDPATLTFSLDETDYPQPVTLSPARIKCLCCGGTAGSRNVITPVSLGTSAALKVMTEGLLEALDEAHRDRPDHDDKERLLIFSDSRQDAAHQARFILFASRYDRMRRAVVRLLDQHGALSIQRAVELLGEAGVEERDNPYAPQEGDAWIPDEALHRIRAWEEAPLLDDLAVTSGYRASLLNLGLVGVRYHRLDEYVRARGHDLATSLGVPLEALEYICRCLLDEMRVRSALSREMLRYHPAHPSCPAHIRAAEWERRVKQPRGYAATNSGEPLAHLETAEVPAGITNRNAWRRPRAGGRGPSLERILRHLLSHFGGSEPDEGTMVAMLDFLRRGSFVAPAELFGYRDRRQLLQVNAENVLLVLLTEKECVRCNVCGLPMAMSTVGFPCPNCHGALAHWPEEEINQNRSVRRIRAPHTIPLVAGEHTAQVPNTDRLKLEEQFKAPASESKVNVLACSPTLEMGIDVGGLDAVAMRNIPPRPDNYAQRGGRAGRRSRVGLVLGYARSTPHDQYFYDEPTEMISGEVPAPALALGNRDVLLRHINAILFSAADPGLAGRMVEYVSPSGEVKQEVVDALIEGIRAQYAHGLQMAHEAFGQAILTAAGLDDDQLHAHIEGLPARVQDVVERTARQVIELRQPLDQLAQQLMGRSAGMRAVELVGRLLGIPAEGQRGQTEADDRSAGYPLRRFAEFGILPGYEFPTEPSALRLLGDPNEHDPITVGRRFGIAQFQPNAQVYARTRRWRVMGLDTASPWNPRSDGPSWLYRVCRGCTLRFRADHPRCPRCRDDTPGPALPAAEFAGFLARRDEGPVLDEEDRYAVRNLVRSYPQWDGDVIGRWRVGGGWQLRLSQREEVQWLNEGIPPTPRERDDGTPCLHSDGKGYLLCGSCGRMLSIPEPDQPAGRGRRRARSGSGTADPHGHKEGCPQAGAAPRPLAIATAGQTEVLRLIVPVPASVAEDGFTSWGLTLGYTLRIGMRHLYMLDGSEIDFELEGPWPTADGESRLDCVSLTFIDPSLGGTGYLDRAAEDFHLVARRALDHLDHPDCETACYRCLKSYTNQRFHDMLRWPLAVSHIEALAAEPPEPQLREIGDIDDPGPWLEAYAEGLGSPLELRFFRLFQEHGFHPEKQVPVAPNASEPPISVADFAVPEHRLAIYVDGASVHVGSNLRRDRHIRERLRKGEPPWRVEELRFQDLGEGRALVERFRRMMQ